ncbi:MAG: RadC family protein [Clostridia bacterium]|nr:RadC family protein [Clostridia bacterium]
MDDCLHTGHRERLKARFLAGGFDSFSDHNVLELLLFYAIPRKDTNEIGHELIRRFGSLAGVLEASVEELMTVKGIGRHAAILIHSILPIAFYYVRSRSDAAMGICDTVEKLIQYAKAQYVGTFKETAKLILMDNHLRVMDCVTLAEGAASRANFDARKIVETAILRHAAMVVLMHNHPGGHPVPSGEDYEATVRLGTVCEAVGVKLLEHLLVGEEETVPILHWARTPAGQDALATSEHSLNLNR